MSEKNFMSYGDAETVFSEYANAIKALDPEGGTLDTRLSAVEDVIPSGASGSNKLATANDFNTASTMSKYAAMQTGSGDTIDLNNYTETGRKWTITRALWTTLTNFPNNYSTHYVVWNINADNSTGYILQLCWALDQDSIYIRRRQNTAWTSWTTLILKTDLTPVAGYCGQYSFDTGTSITIRLDSTAFRRVTIYQDAEMYSFVVHEWGATPKYHWIVGTALPSGIATSYSSYRLTFTNNSFGTARMVIEAPSNPVV